MVMQTICCFRVSYVSVTNDYALEPFYSQYFVLAQLLKYDSLVGYMHTAVYRHITAIYARRLLGDMPLLNRSRSIGK